MGRFSGAVIAADHDPPVEGEPGEDRQRCVAVETVRLVDVGNVLARLAERRDFEIAVDTEGLADGNLYIRRCDRRWRGCRLLNGWHCFWCFLALLGKGGAGNPVW